MKLLTMLLLASGLLFAYQKGDRVDPEILKKMELQSGKIYVIDFFASWCSSCKTEMPLLIKAGHAIASDKSELIGVDVDKDHDKGVAFQKELAIDFRVINDNDNSIIQAFDPLGMPSLYVVKDGKVLDLLYGAHDGIDQLIIDEIHELSQ